ncbi:MAG: MFS transporter, partial [Microbacterium sp.]
MPAWLFALLAAAFVLYTDDYVIAGILPELAGDLGVSEGQAGQLITVFSLTVALAAPVAAVVLARAERRRLFSLALLVFIAANAAAAITPSFTILMVLRIVAALAAASTTPALFAFAARHAPLGQTGRYIAVVSLGVTGSIAA